MEISNDTMQEIQKALKEGAIKGSTLCFDTAIKLVKSKQNIVNALINIIKEGEREGKGLVIPGVIYYRKLTGCGLKEAKNYVEQVIVKYIDPEYIEKRDMAK